MKITLSAKDFDSLTEKKVYTLSLHACVDAAFEE